MIIDRFLHGLFEMYDNVTICSFLQCFECVVFELQIQVNADKWQQQLEYIWAVCLPASNLGLFPLFMKTAMHSGPQLPTLISSDMSGSSELLCF